MSAIGTSLAILGVSVTTLLTRGSFVLFGRQLKLPLTVERALVYAPGCALAAIVAPDLVYVHGALDLSLTNPRLIAAVAATFAFVVSRSLIATILIGMAVYTGLRYFPLG